MHRSKSRDELRILIVDDDLVLRSSVAEILTGLGWTVRSAADGADALRVLDVWRPDVILLDVNMPGAMDGPALRSELARRRHTADIPIVLTTAASLVHEEALKLGVAGELAKPFGVDELLECLQPFKD